MRFGQLLLTDFTVVKVMLSAVLVGMIGVYAMKSAKVCRLHCRIGTVGAAVIGGLIFGAGFATLGYCPGTAAAAVGSGAMDALMGMNGMVAAVPPDTEVKGGETFKVGDFDFEIIWTPGHSPGHICLYEADHKMLFTGDHILPTITPSVSIHAQTHGSPLGDYMRSLEKLLDLDVTYVLPALEFDWTAA